MECLKRSIIVCAGLVSLTGCHAMKPSGYLADYAILHEGIQLEKVWIDPNAKIPSSSVIHVTELNTDRIHDQKGVTVEDVMTWLKEDLERFAKESDMDLTFDEVSDTQGFSLELGVTKMTPGDAFARIMAAELGAGHAVLQLEGRLINGSSNKKIMIFSDRRGDSAAIGLADLGGDAGPSLIKKMIADLSKDIILEIKSVMES